MTPWVAKSSESILAINPWHLGFVTENAHESCEKNSFTIANGFVGSVASSAFIAADAWITKAAP